MSEPRENYVPSTIAARFQGQAARVWIVTTSFVLLWVSLIVAAPLAKANGHSASHLYSFFGHICHQLTERSFHIDGEQFAVCSRCFGVYFGLLAGLAVYPLWRSIDEIGPLPRVWLFLSLVPVAIDWLLGVLDIWENTQLSRFFTGLILGAACATYIMPALVEITRNTMSRRQTRKAA